MKNILYIIFLFEFILGQNIQINEIVSSNGIMLYDEDGDTPDWIELYNIGDQEINLNGYGITDDPENLSKWIFPSIVIEPNNFLLIFASNKNRKEIVTQWDAVIDWGDSWHYWVGLSEPVNNWELPETDISFWNVGNSGFGFGDDDDNTTITQTISIYIKKEFTIDDPSIVNKLIFHLDYDDGYVAYLNGIEFSRRNLGPAGSPVYYNTTTTGLHEAEIYSGGSPETVEIDLALFPLQENTNTLAIEVHNYSFNSSDLTCIPFLTLGYNTELQNISGPDPLLNLPSVHLHSNFKLNSTGETLVISDLNEVILDSISFDSIKTNMSFGRNLEGSSWVLFPNPTPGSSNSTPSYAGVLAPIEFSMASGFINEPQITVELSTPDESAEIYFTTDGTTPSMDDFNYEYSIPLTNTTVIRARAFLNDWLPSETETKTYIFGENEPIGVPVIFLSTDPINFFGEDSGIYVMGSNASPDFPHFGANFWEDWERPLHFEIMEQDGSSYSTNAGVKIFGGWSRGFPQKSLSIYSRNYFGPSEFNYNFFPDHITNSFESFVLRNSGNDWTHTMFRDGFTTSLTHGLGIDHQEYRPTITYLNGEYWGIHNIREKVSEHFLASHYSLNTENINLLGSEPGQETYIVHGTDTDYLNLLDYISNNDINDLLVQNALENWIDIESYMKYQAFQILIDNRDWPGNNIKFWRDNRIGGKWRWILYDTDFGFGIWDPWSFTFNTLDFALEPNGPDWPNPPWSTYLFRKLIENNNFKYIFINTYCDLLNTTFEPENLLNHLDSITNNIINLIPLHQERWNIQWGGGCCWGAGSALNFEDNINVIQNFSINRQLYARNHIQDQFSLPNIALVKLYLEPEGSGSIQLNSLNINEDGWSGYYFPNIPINATAVPNNGFIFSGWSEFPDSSSSLTMSVTDPFILTAIFEPTNLSEGSIIINEINYNSSDDHDSGDWIELFNPGESELDLSNWVFKDENNDHNYIIPNETILNSEAYLIISNDLLKFQEFYSTDIPIFGPFEFGLSGGGDEVRIFNNIGELIDSVQYDDNEPWPTEPDGDGPTLELLNPNMDNSTSQSWASSNYYGTPGQQNSTYQYLDIDKQLYLPNEFHFYPSYPNPFNPSTTITFDIPKITNEQETQINVYNLRGQKIKTILNNRLRSGKHEMQWHPTHISSGVYFLQLKIGEKTLNQKITYLK